MVLALSPAAVTSPSDFTPASSKEFLDIQATIGCGFTLKRVRDMTRTYSNLIFNDTDKNKELLEIYDDVFHRIMSKIKKKIDDNWLEYSKGYKKFKFNSDDNLPPNKQLKFHTMTITSRCVISEENKLYPQVFLDEAL